MEDSSESQIAFSRIIQGKAFFLYSFQIGRDRPILHHQPLITYLCPTSQTLSLDFLTDIHFHTVSVGEEEPIQIGIFSLETGSTPLACINSHGSPEVNRELQRLLGVVIKLSKEKKTMDFECPGYRHIGLYEIRDYTVEDYHIRGHPATPLSEGSPPATFSLYYRQLEREQIENNLVYKHVVKKRKCNLYFVSNPSIVFDAHHIFQNDSIPS